MKNNNRSAVNTVEAQRKTIGPELNFASSEAYKLLRTNISLTVPKEEGCRLLGVTSTFAGEGKSTTSANLSYAIAEDGKRVLLLEGDLRKPTVAERLGINASPGLSNLLVGLCSANEAVQSTGLHKNLYVLTAGDIPPNPSELLNSKQMELAISALSKSFDYIILDLPPISAVADALVITKLVHSVIVVVRRGYCKKQALQKTLHQLDMINASVLGLVMTHGEVHVKKYRKYGYGYSYGYGYGYGSTASGSSTQSSESKSK